MNILPLLLGLFAMQMFGNKNKKPGGKPDSDAKAGANPFENLGGGMLGGLLNNPEALASLGSITKLFDKNSTQDEKSAAIFSLLSNPAVFELAKQFFTSQANAAKESKERNADSYAGQAGPEEVVQPSEEARQMFRPVSTIAGVEISDKLCHLYDNWYIKK